jgi:hypothetical protein
MDVGRRRSQISSKYFYAPKKRETVSVGLRSADAGSGRREAPRSDRACVICRRLATSVPHDDDASIEACPRADRTLGTPRFAVIASRHRPSTESVSVA